MKVAKVKIRTVPLKDNRESIRLDIYPPVINPATGKKTRWYYTGLFLFTKPKTALDREHNKETKALAENERAKKQLEIQAGQLGFLNKRELNTDFIEFFGEIARKRGTTKSSPWPSAFNMVKRFFGESFSMADLTIKECEKFKEFLLTAKDERASKDEAKNIGRNTAKVYFEKFRTALRQAYKDGLITVDFNQHQGSIKQEDTERQYLTLEEFNTLAKAECSSPMLKRAALFSGLTGLRFSDIQKLTWSEVNHSKAGGYCIRFRQKKTKSSDTQFISDQAAGLLGVTGPDDERLNGKADQVFEGLEYNSMNNYRLKNWIKAAGITKHITFHCFRHTFATLQLSMGTDIYTVSKMLGHKDLKNYSDLC